MREKRIVVDLPQTLQKKFKDYCRENGLKQKHVLTNIISKHLLDAETHPNYFKKLKEQRADT